MSIDNLSGIPMDKHPDGFFDKATFDMHRGAPDEKEALRRATSPEHLAFGRGVLMLVREAFLEPDERVYRIPGQAIQPKAGVESLSEGSKDDPGIPDLPADERAKDPDGFYDF